MQCGMSPYRLLSHCSSGALCQNGSLWPIRVQAPGDFTYRYPIFTWWRHQMDTFPRFWPFCAGNSPVTGEFHTQTPVTRSFDVFYDLHLDKRLNKLTWCWWFGTPSGSFWRHCAGVVASTCPIVIDITLSFTSTPVAPFTNMDNFNPSTDK